MMSYARKKTAGEDNASLGGQSVSRDAYVPPFNMISKALGVDRTDLAPGKKIIFAATGVTDGRMLRGVRFGHGIIETETVVMRSASGTVRRIVAEHRKLDKFE